MNRAELVERVATATQRTKAEVRTVVEAVVDEIGACLAQGERVDVHGLGVFTTQARAAKKGRNPRTGEPVDVPATTVVKFRPARSVKETVATK